jgi:hypothetical protein
MYGGEAILRIIKMIAEFDGIVEISFISGSPNSLEHGKLIIKPVNGFLIRCHT